MLFTPPFFFWETKSSYRNQRSSHPTALSHLLFWAVSIPRSNLFRKCSVDLEKSGCPVLTAGKPETPINLPDIKPVKVGVDSGRYRVAETTQSHLVTCPKIHAGVLGHLIPVASTVGAVIHGEGRTRLGDLQVQAGRDQATGSTFPRSPSR